MCPGGGFMNYLVLAYCKKQGFLNCSNFLLIVFRNCSKTDMSSKNQILYILFYEKLHKFFFYLKKRHLYMKKCKKSKNIQLNFSEINICLSLGCPYSSYQVAFSVFSSFKRNYTFCECHLTNFWQKITCIHFSPSTVVRFT